LRIENNIKDLQYLNIMKYLIIIIHLGITVIFLIKYLKDQSIGLFVEIRDLMEFIIKMKLFLKTVIKIICSLK
jgi:ethanolamine transporter EutH